MWYVCRTISRMPSSSGLFEQSIETTLTKAHIETIYFDIDAGIFLTIQWCGIITPLHISNPSSVHHSTGSTINNSDDELAWASGSNLSTVIYQIDWEAKNLSNIVDCNLSVLLWTELVLVLTWKKKFHSNFIVFFCIGLGVFGFVFLPSGFSSFDIASNNATLGNLTNFGATRESIGRYSYLPLALILIMQFFITIGITTIPSLLTSEVFPFK